MPKIPIRPRAKKPDLRVSDILAWADAYHRHHGRWPFILAGRIPETADKTWAAVNQALVAGHPADAPQLTLALIRRWVRVHHEATGGWPKYTSGPIPGVPGETWGAVDNSLHKGRRGLNGGLSLAGVVREYRLADG
jgi:hypothetical protein